MGPSFKGFFFFPPWIKYLWVNNARNSLEKQKKCSSSYMGTIVHVLKKKKKRKENAKTQTLAFITVSKWVPSLHLGWVKFFSLFLLLFMDPIALFDDIHKFHYTFDTIHGFHCTI